MNKLSFFLAFLSFLLNGHVAVAQVKPVVHFTENEGLAANRVWDVVLDADGILWIATDNGISRFDGSSFDNLYVSNGLLSPKVVSLALGSNREMYASCSLGGLVVIRDESIQSALRKDDKTAKQHYFRELHYSKRYNKLFVGTENGLYVLHDSTLVEVNYKKDTSDRSIILSITESPQGIFFTVLKGKSQGFYHLNYNSNYPGNSTASRISNVMGRFASTYVNGELFCGEQNKIFSYDGKPPFKVISETAMDSVYWAWELFPYKDNLMWIGGLGDGRFRGCIKLFDTREKKFLPFELPQNIQTVNCIFYDPRSDVTWFGRDNGLTAYKESPFDYIDFKGKENILDKGFIGDSLIILTEDRILHYNYGNFESILTREKVRKVVESHFNAGQAKYGKEKWGVFDISFGSEFSSLINDGKRLFLQTGSGTISIPDLETYLPFGIGKFVLTHDNSTKTQGAYAAGDYEQARYFPDLRHPDRYTLIENTPGIDYKISSAFMLNGVIYLASLYNGLLTVKDNKVIRLNRSNSVIENNIIGMCQGPGNEVLCFSGSRIFRVVYESGPRVAGELDMQRIGIIGNSIKWIEYNGIHLFVATNEGLNVISLNKGHNINKNIKASGEGYFDEARVVKFYNANNGYGFVSALSPIKDSKGNILVHTGNEVVIIKPVDVSKSKLDINIHGVIVNDKMIDVAALEGSSLPYSSRQISFKFRGIKYPTGRNLKYRYKVNNERWIQGNQVMLQSLRPGDYEIVLEMTDIENNRVITRKVNFTLASPFWHTSWFLGSSIIIIILLIYLSFRWRYNILRRREEEKTRLVIENSELQLRSLQFQMNPHFIFNALTSIQYSILKNNVTESLSYLNSVSAIIRTSLTNASKEYIPVTEEVEFLNKYIQMERVRFKDKLKIELHTRDTDSNLLMPPMLVQPIVENAIKHAINPTEGGTITIEFVQETDILRITVKDNGIGMKASMLQRSHNHPHFGLATVEKRLALLNRVDKTNLNSLNIIDLKDSAHTPETAHARHTQHASQLTPVTSITTSTPHTDQVPQPTQSFNTTRTLDTVDMLEREISGTMVTIKLALKRI